MILPAQDDKIMMSTMMAQFGGLANLVGGAGISFGSPTTADLYVTILKSEAVQDPIIDRFKLKEIYKNKYRTDAYRELDKSVDISAGKKDGIITILVDDKDPKRAAEMANAYVEELGKLAVKLNVTGAGQNRVFLEERLGKARTDLAKAEDDLKTFQAKNKAIDVRAQAEATIRGVADMRAQLAVQEVQLATYRRQFTDSSQEVKNLSISVANLRSQIAKLEGSGRNTESAIPSVGSVPTLEQHFIRLKREFKTQESLVELLTKQYEMTKLSEAQDNSPFQVILKAHAPERKSKPARSIIVLLSICFMFCISVLIAFILENFSQIPQTDKIHIKELFNSSFFKIK